MRKSSLFFLLLTLLQIPLWSQKNDQTLWIEKDDDCQCTPLTEDIYKRYYIIARLASMYNLLNQMKPTHQKQLAQLFRHIDKTQFSNAYIIKCIENIQEQGNLEPLFTHWNHLNYYQDVIDEEYAQEFVDLITLLTQSFVEHLGKKSNYIDHYKMTQPLLEQAADQHLIYHIVFRFFLLHRLAQAIKLIEHLHKSHTFIFNPLPSLQQQIITDPIINSYYTSILIQKTLEPLLSLWHKFESFDSITDFNYSKQFILLILLTYHSIVHDHVAPEIKKLLNTHIQSINNKTTLELLGLIDEYVVITSRVLNHNESPGMFISFLKNGTWPFWRLGNWLIGMTKGRL